MLPYAISSASINDEFVDLTPIRQTRQGNGTLIILPGHSNARAVNYMMLSREIDEGPEDIQVLIKLESGSTSTDLMQFSLQKGERRVLSIPLIVPEDTRLIAVTPLNSNVTIYVDTVEIAIGQPFSDTGGIKNRRRKVPENGRLKGFLDSL